MKMFYLTVTTIILTFILIETQLISENKNFKIKIILVIKNKYFSKVVNSEAF